MENKTLRIVLYIGLAMVTAALLWVGVWALSLGAGGEGIPEADLWRAGALSAGLVGLWLGVVLWLELGWR